MRRYNGFLFTRASGGLLRLSAWAGRMRRLSLVEAMTTSGNITILLLLSLAPLATEACAGTIQIVNINDVSSLASNGPGGSPYQLENTPFAFSALDVASLRSLDSISFDVPISNLQSAPGQTYFNELFLALNGLNTGIALNLDSAGGIITFPYHVDKDKPVTRNNSLILESLRAIDTIRVSLLDLSSPSGNSPLVITGGRGLQTLALNGSNTDPSAAPEPGTVGLMLTGVALVIVGYRKRPS